MRTRTLGIAVAAALCALAVAVPVGERRLHRLRQGRQRPPGDAGRLAHLPGHQHRWLLGRLAGRRRHDDRAARHPAAPPRSHGQRARRLRHARSPARPATAPASPARSTRPSRPTAPRSPTRTSGTPTSQDPSCMPPTCYTTIHEGGTGYTWSDRQTGWDDPALGKHSGWLFPAWIDNDNTMLSFPTHALQLRRHHRPDQRRRLAATSSATGSATTVGGNPAIGRRRHLARQAQARVPDRRGRLDADALPRPELPDDVEGRRRRAAPSARPSATATAARTATASRSRRFSPDGSAGRLARG